MNNFELEKYIVKNIDEAIKQKWIKIYYQPVIRVVNGRLCGMEALARWDDPEYGLLSPRDFIHVLEDHDLIDKLDDYIINEACRELRARINEGLDIVPFSFNLSRKDFELCDIFEVVDSAVRQYEISKEFVNIEITESALNQDSDKMQKEMERFSKAGYKVWMDDFGSGYSSLNILKDFDFDEIKIDMKFIQDFSDKARRIVMSVINMAKELNIQTLAEGVETEEQLEFLKTIGCEKAQGFLFSKPLPGAQCMEEIGAKHIKIESLDEIKYYDDIGRTNVLSTRPLAQPIDYGDARVKDRWESSIPLAIVEYDSDSCRYLYYNYEHQNTLKELGWDSVEDSLKALNENKGAENQKFWNALENTKVTGRDTFDYTLNGNYCSLEFRKIAQYGERCAIIYSITNISKEGKIGKIEKLDSNLRHLYGIYNGVYSLDLKNDLLEVLYIGSAEDVELTNGSITEITAEHAEKYVFDEDCKHYLKFFEISTLEDKISKSERGFINAYIRTRTVHGDYTWKIYLALMVAPQHALVFVRNADSIKATAWAEYYQNYSTTMGGDVGSELTKELLWDNLSRNSGIGLFWKDKQRRFVGANQKFMDYYGFKSPSDFVGKTDEEMGWHVASEPYRKDEYRVLREGAVTHRIPGHCIAHGSIRDICASKMPVYDNGRIIGLIGYFEDVTDTLHDHASQIEIQETDKLTGLLNIRGMMAAISTYRDEYERRGTDFAEIYFSVDNFHELMTLHGTAFGDEILYAIGKKLSVGFGTSATLARYSGDDFMAFMQFSNQRDVDNAAEMIRRLVGDIHQVNGYSCTLYPSVGSVKYSEVNDLNEMHRVGFDRMASDRALHQRNMQ